MSIEEMFGMQIRLQEKYKPIWGGALPEKVIKKMLWLHGELGEASDIIKKNGMSAILGDSEVRKHFIEEMCDVMMYVNDVFVCFGITPDKTEKIYREKHENNMTRWQDRLKATEV